jgi:hypothetical protein
MCLIRAVQMKALLAASLNECISQSNKAGTSVVDLKLPGVEDQNAIVEIFNTLGERVYGEKVRVVDGETAERDTVY